MLGRKLSRPGFLFFSFFPLPGVSLRPPPHPSNKRRVGPGSEENNSQPLLSF